MAFRQLTLQIRQDGTKEDFDHLVEMVQPLAVLIAAGSNPPQQEVAFYADDMSKGTEFFKRTEDLKAQATAIMERPPVGATIEVHLPADIDQNVYREVVRMVESHTHALQKEVGLLNLRKFEVVCYGEDFFVGDTYNNVPPVPEV